MLFVGL